MNTWKIPCVWDQLDRNPTYLNYTACSNWPPLPKPHSHKKSFGTSQRLTMAKSHPDVYLQKGATAFCFGTLDRTVCCQVTVTGLWCMWEVCVLLFYSTSGVWLHVIEKCSSSSSAHAGKVFQHVLLASVRWSLTILKGNLNELLHTCRSTRGLVQAVLNIRGPQ